MASFIVSPDHARAVRHASDHFVSSTDLDLLAPVAVRVARIERTIRRGAASTKHLQALTGVSVASLKRDLTLLRQMGALVTYDVFDDGYELRNADWPGVAAFVAAELRKWV